MENFSNISQMVYNGETILITRPHNLNLVLITEADYNANYNKKAASRKGQAGKLADTKDRHKAIALLDGLLAGDEVVLDDIRAVSRPERFTKRCHSERSEEY